MNPFEPRPFDVEAYEKSLGKRASRVLYHGSWIVRLRRWVRRLAWRWLP
jgi:hypothetical protein